MYYTTISCSHILLVYVDKEKPLLDEDIEVKHMKRLEQVRARHPYHAISEDQSGWVLFSSNSENPISSINDMYPPHKRKGVDLSPHQQLKKIDTPSPNYGTSDLQDISPPQ